MKVTFKKVLYEEFDIDFQKIYDLIVQKTGKDDLNALYDEFADDAEYYLSQTHDLNSIFDKYDLMFSFSDNDYALECIVDNFYVFLRDKFGI
jgi:hypothetical protein